MGTGVVERAVRVGGMADQTLIEIHVKGLPEIAALAADELMNLAQMRGYIVRVNEAVEGIQRGDGWLALDYGDKEKTSAEAEIGELIDGINGGDTLTIEESGQLGSD
jgi:hypothetical protein